MFKAIRTVAAWGLLAAAFLPSLPSKRAGQATFSPEAAKSSEGVQATGGKETGSPHPLQLDEQHRPITAGGFVKTGPVVFEDVSEKAGLTKWTHKMGTPPKNYIVETKGSGVGLIDYDNDGWLDIYLVNGSTFDALDGKETPPHAALFHNNHDGTFTDVAAKAGVTNDRWGFGVAIADYDNDGWPDIYVSTGARIACTTTTTMEHLPMWQRRRAWQLGNWSTGATWGDYDGDGRLDLFVAGYLHYDRNHLPSRGANGVPNAFCTFRGEKVSCGPRGLKGEPRSPVSQ